MDCSDTSITVTPEMLNVLKCNNRSAFDAIVAFLAIPASDSDKDAKADSHPLFFNASKNTETYDYVPQSGYGFHHDGKKLHAFSYDCVTKNRSKDLFGAKLDELLKHKSEMADKDKTEKEKKALFVAADTIASAFVDLVQEGNNDQVSYSYLAEKALEVLSDDIKKEIKDFQYSAGAALGLVTELVARDTPTNLFIKATKPRDNRQLTGLEALNERYIEQVYAFITPLQQTKAVLSSNGINVEKSTWAQEVIKEAPNLDKLVQLSFEDLVAKSKGIHPNERQTLHEMYAGMHSRPEDIKPPPVRRHMLNSGVNMEIALALENSGHYDLADLSDKDIYKLDETIFGQKFEFSDEKEKMEYFKQVFQDENFDPDTAINEQDNEKKKYIENKQKRDDYYKNNKDVVKRTMNGRQSSLNEGGKGRNIRQRFTPGMKSPSVIPLASSVKASSVVGTVGKVGASTALSGMGASTALAGMGALAASAAAVAGPIALGLAMVPMIKDMAKEAEQEMNESLASSHASRERAEAKVSDLINSLETNTDEKNKQAIAKAKQLLDEVRKPNSFGKANHQGLDLLKQFDQMGMNLVASDMGALKPYKTDAAMVAAIDGGRMLKALCLYIDGVHIVLRPQRQLLDTPEFVNVMGPSRPFQTLRTRSTSESSTSSFINSTSTSGFSTAVMTSNSSSSNVSGSANYLIASAKGGKTRANQHTSETNTSRSETEEARQEKNMKTTTALVSEFVFQPMKEISLAEGGLILTAYAYYRLQKIVDYFTAVDFFQDFGSHVPFGNQTVGGVFVQTMKITTTSEKSTTELYASASAQLSTVNKTASTQETEATARTGLLGMGPKITTTNSVSNASASGYTNTDMSAHGEGNTATTSNASFESTVTCFGPNAATAGSMYEQLMSNNATWTIIDRGEPDSYFAIWDLIDYIGQGGTFKDQVKHLKQTWEELALRNSNSGNNYLLEKLMGDYKMKKRMVDFVDALSSCIIPKNGMFTGELADQFKAVVDGAVKGQQTNKNSTTPALFITAGFEAMKKEAKNNTTPQLFEVVENCDIYEEVQEYLDEFGTRDWGEFIYHETRWKADIIDKGKPSYLLSLIRDCYYGVDNWSLVRKLVFGIKNFKRYASYQDEDGYFGLQYCIHAMNVNVMSIFDLIVKFYVAYPAAMRNKDPVNNSDKEGIKNTNDWKILTEKITDLAKYTIMEEFLANLDLMKKFVEILSCCIVPTRGSFEVGLAGQFKQVVGNAVEAQGSLKSNDVVSFVGVGFTKLTEQEKNSVYLFKVVDNNNAYYDQAQELFNKIKAKNWFGFVFESATIDKELLMKGNPEYLRHLRRESSANGDKYSGLVHELEKPIVDIDFGNSVSNAKYTKYGATVVDDYPRSSFRALRCQNGEDQKQYAVISDTNISPSNMPDCTVTIGLKIVDIPNYQGNDNCQGFVLNNDNDDWERAIVMHFDSSKPFLSLGDEEASKSNIWGGRTFNIIGEWMYVSAVFRKDGECFMYINKEKSDPVLRLPSKMQEGLPDLYIGCKKDGDSSGCNCWVREVKVFNRALSDDDIEKLSHQFYLNLLPNPLIEIDFGNSTHDSKYDVSNAEVKAGAPLISGKALLCNNTGNVGKYAKIGEYDISPSKMPDCTLTIGCFVKSEPAKKNGWILSNENGGYDRAISMHDNKAVRKPCLMLGENPNNAHPWGSDVPDIVGRWIYVTAVFRKNGDSFIFIDRKKSAGMTKTNNAPQDGTPDLYVGCPSTSATNGCDCWVKEVKVFGITLTDQEINALSDQFHEKYKWSTLADLCEEYDGDGTLLSKVKESVDSLKDNGGLEASAKQTSNEGHHALFYVTKSKDATLIDKVYNAYTDALNFETLDLFYEHFVDKYTPTFQWGNNILTNVKDMVTICGHLFVLMKDGRLLQRKGDDTWEIISDKSSLKDWLNQYSILVKYDENTVAVVQVVNLEYRYQSVYVKYTAFVNWASQLPRPNNDTYGPRIRVDLFQVSQSGATSHTVKHESIRYDIILDETSQTWKQSSPFQKLRLNKKPHITQFSLASTGQWFGRDGGDTIFRGSKKDHQGSNVNKLLKNVEISWDGRFAYGFDSSKDVYYTRTNDTSGLHWQQLDKEADIKKICVSGDGSKQWKLCNNDELFENTLV